LRSSDSSETFFCRNKQEALQKEWEEYGDQGDSTGDSRKDMIKKGLDALQIKEGGVKFKTDQQKKLELERQKEAKKEAAKKEEEEAKEDHGTPSKSPAKVKESEESEEMKRRRMIYKKIKELNEQEGNTF